MNDIIQTLAGNLVYAVAGLIAVCAALLCALLITWFQLRGLQKRADRFFGSRSDRRSLEARLADYKASVGAMGERYDDILALIDDINERLRFCVQKVGVVRYNPFDGMGGDLSFAVALLDEQCNGVVFNTVHGREASYTYAKPVVGGESSYTLSLEERQAIEAAMRQNKLVASYLD